MVGDEKLPVAPVSSRDACSALASSSHIPKIPRTMTDPIARRSSPRTTAIARIGGYPVAQAFAGHTPATVTGRYLHATPAEVAAAVAVMTGEPDPAKPAAVARPVMHTMTPLACP